MAHSYVLSRSLHKMLLEIKTNPGSGHPCPVRHFAVPHVGRVADQTASCLYPDALCTTAA